MIILFGHYLTEIASEPVLQAECFSCKSQGTMNVRRYSKAWHLFYVPITPYGFVDEVVCTNCHRELQYKQMNEENHARYDQYRLSKAPPWWHYVGGFLILGLIVRAFLVAEFHETKMLGSVDRLDSSWIVDYIPEEKQYSSFIVREADDSVMVIQYNYYQTSDKNSLTSFAGEEYFTGTLDTIWRSELTYLIKEGLILDIHERE